MKEYSIPEIERLAQYAAESGLYNMSVPQCFMVILRGTELGIGASQALMELRVIKGKLTLSAATIGAMIQRSKNYSYAVLKLEEDECHLRFFTDGDVSGESNFSFADAEKAGLTTRWDAKLGKTVPNEMYEKFARNMLFARALTNGARWYCPEVFGGAVYTADELKGSPEETEAPKLPVQVREVVEKLPVRIMEPGTYHDHTGMGNTEPSVETNGAEAPSKEPKQYKLSKEPPANTLMELQWDTLEMMSYDVLKRFYTKAKDKIGLEDRQKIKELADRKKAAEAAQGEQS